MVKRNIWSNKEEKEFRNILYKQTEFPDWNIISKLLKKKKIYR